MLLDKHNVQNLDCFWVNGDKFSGIAREGLLTVNTKTYVTEPTRTNNGSMPDINEQDTFIVPRAKFNFKYMDLESYQRLSLYMLANEFTLMYYDKQLGKFVTHKMYCESEEQTKLFNIGTDVFGVFDYYVSCIGTLNEVDSVKVRYNTLWATDFPMYDTDGKEYNYNDIVRHYGKYYRVIYQDTVIEGDTPSAHNNYWTYTIAIETQDNGTIDGTEAGNIYCVIINEKPAYYSAKTDGVTVFNRFDTSNFEPINAEEYESTTQYDYGDYCYTYDETNNTYSLWKANKNVHKFTSSNSIVPPNETYFEKYDKLNGYEVIWGEQQKIWDGYENSYIGSNLDKELVLKIAPSGYHLKCWCTQEYRVFETNTFYAEGNIVLDKISEKFYTVLKSGKFNNRPALDTTNFAEYNGSFGYCFSPNASINILYGLELYPLWTTD